MPKYICLSNLPGLIIEGSSKSGLLVAPITNISPIFHALSICDNNSATILSMTCPESLDLPLFGIKASSSSKKIMHGLA